MTLLNMAKTTSCEIRKAFFFLLFITGWIAVAIVPIHIDNTDESNRIATLILSIPPIPLTSFYIIVAFVYVAFNKNPDDDSKINIIALMIVLVAWVVSWSSLYLVYWSWDSTSFPNLPATGHPYKAWGYMLGISAGIYVADQPFIADAHVVSLVLFVAIQSVLSIFINIAVLGTIVAMTYAFVNERNKRLKKTDDYPTNAPVQRQVYNASYQPPADFVMTVGN
jgi:hypothetical protein